MTKKTSITFAPDPEQLALMPDISDNVINGQDEADFRRPIRIYWHNPSSAIPYGKIQEWMVRRFNRVPAFREVYAKGDRGPQKLDPVAIDQTQDSPVNWAARATTRRHMPVRGPDR